jgi:hypothetical protein
MAVDFAYKIRGENLLRIKGNFAAFAVMLLVWMIEIVP